MEFKERKEFVSNAFLSHFGKLPTVWVRAPGRVDLMGSHADYNEGFVLTLSINRDTWIAARPREDSGAHIHSLNNRQSCKFDLREILSSGSQDWELYVKGVAYVLQQEGYRFSGFDAIIHGTVPISSGLSSSASLECATAMLLEQLGSFEVERVRLAKLCQRAENEVAGVNCGILDQYSSLMGQKDNAIVLDCRHLTHEVAHFPGGLRVVICNTCAPRKLSGSEYGERRAACESGAQLLSQYNSNIRFLRDVSIEFYNEHESLLPGDIAKRCRFVIEENERVLEMAKALSQDNCERISELCTASFEGARDLYEISVSQMEEMMTAMISSPGIVGARQAGAGFGGCMVAVVESEMVEAFSESVARDYRRQTGIIPEIYPVEIAEGAGILVPKETAK